MSQERNHPDYVTVIFNNFRKSKTAQFQTFVFQSFLVQVRVRLGQNYFSYTKSLKPRGLFIPQRCQPFAIFRVQQTSKNYRANIKQFHCEYLGIKRQGGYLRRFRYACLTLI